MNNETIIKFVRENRWIIIASIFFIVWKFFLIGVLWHDRLSPPEPDDSYSYIGYINSVKLCPQIICNYPYISFSSYEGFTYLPYRLFFGSISKFFNLSPETVFHFSFYFGIAILLPILIVFVRNFTSNKNLMAFSLFFLTLYNGSGAYHGFFWVVPSFFAFALFLLIFSIINGHSKKWWLYLILIIPIFIYLNPISIYAIVIFPIFYFIYSFSTKKFDRDVARKTLFAIIFSVLSYLPLYYHLSIKQENPLGIKNTVGDVIENIADVSSPTKSVNKLGDLTDQNTNLTARKPVLFPSFSEIKKGYLDWLFPHWIAVLPFTLFLFLVIYYKNYKLLSLYLSISLFILLSSLNIYGYRSLVFIWPITFVFYAFGFWNLGKFISEKWTVKKKLSSPILITAISFFVAINMLFSLFWCQDTNSRNNFKIDSNFAQYLLDNTKEGDTIMFDSKTLHSFGLTTPLLKRITGVGPLRTGKYLVFLNDNQAKSSATESNLNKFFDVLSKTLGIPRTHNNNPKDSAPDNNDLALEKTFGLVSIYRNKNYY